MSQGTQQDLDVILKIKIEADEARQYTIRPLKIVTAFIESTEVKSASPKL